MRRASDLFGLPVVDSDRRNIGTVREILVDLPRGVLAALIMPVKVLAEPDLIPVDRTVDIGADEVRLSGGKASISGDEGDGLRQGKLTLEQVRKLTVVTRSGNRLGNVEDLVIDGSRIASLELSDGLIQDIFQGRETVQLTRELKVQEEHIIVPDGTKCQPPERNQKGSWRHDQGL